MESLLALAGVWVYGPTHLGTSQQPCKVGQEGMSLYQPVPESIASFTSTDVCLNISVFYSNYELLWELVLDEK